MKFRIVRNGLGSYRIQRHKWFRWRLLSDDEMYELEKNFEHTRVFFTGSRGFYATLEEAEEAVNKFYQSLRPLKVVKECVDQYANKVGKELEKEVSLDA